MTVNSLVSDAQQMNSEEVCMRVNTRVVAGCTSRSPSDLLIAGHHVMGGEASSDRALPATTKGAAEMLRFLLVLLVLSGLAAPAVPDEWQDPGISFTPGARFGHSMVNLNGEIHVFGGQTGDARIAGRPKGMVLNDLWRLNGEQAAWEEQQAANPPSARYRHATVAYNGKLYALFGKDSAGSSLSDVWRYDPTTVAWSLRSGAAPCGGRAGHAVAVAGGVVWITGGATEQGDSREVWTYDPGMNTWASKPDLPCELAGHSVVNYNGLLYVYGGSHLLKFDPDQNEWVELSPASMPPARTHHIAVMHGEAAAMRVFGGQDSEGIELSDGWEYSVVSNAWSYLGEMPLTLTQSAAAMLYASGVRASRQRETDRMVVFGGLSGGEPTDITLIYAPELDSPPRPQPLPAASLLMVTPNPSTGPFHITLRSSSRLDGTVQILNLKGHLVRSLRTESNDSVAWDARDDAGLPVPCGVYTIRLQGRPITHWARAVIVR